MTSRGDRSTRPGSSTASRIIGGDLRDEPDGSTDRAAWLGPDELGRFRLVDARRAGRRASQSGPLMTATIGIDSPRRPSWSSRWPGTSRAGRDLLPHYPLGGGRAASRTAPRCRLRRAAAVRRRARASALPVAWRVADLVRARDAPAALRPPRRRHAQDGRDLADRADAAGGLPRRRSSTTSGRVPGLARVRRPPVHAADRRSDAGHVQGDRRGGRDDEPTRAGRTPA